MTKFLRNKIWIAYIFNTLLCFVLIFIYTWEVYKQNEINMRKYDLEAGIKIHEHLLEDVTNTLKTTREAIRELEHNSTNIPARGYLLTKSPEYKNIYIITVNKQSLQTELKAKVYKSQIYTSTNTQFKEIHLNDLQFDMDSISRTLQTRTIQTSSILNNKHGDFVQINYPVFNHTGEVESLIIGELDPEYIRNQLTEFNTLCDYEYIQSSGGQILFNDKPMESKADSILSQSFKNLPWTQNCPVYLKSYRQNIHDYAPYYLFCFILSTAILITYLFLEERRKKKNAEIFINNQKIELVGKMAASVAHEIRNPLTGIKGLTKLLCEEDLSQDKKNYYHSIIENEVNRIDQIATEFLVLDKNKTEDKQPYNLRKIIEEIQHIIEIDLLLNEMKLKLELNSVSSQIICDKNHIKQVILNLVKNAMDASPKGSTLYVSLNRKDEDIFLVFRDEGCGILEDHLEEVFSPFYTTKPDGTGLGLIICKQIVESFKGEITIHSIHNEGTTVTIKFPVYKE